MSGSPRYPPGASLRGGVPAGAKLLLDLPFAEAQLANLRSAVAGHARAAGLSTVRTREFVLVAYELATNAVRHGGGSGRLRLWAGESSLHCQVTDRGPGMASGVLDAGKPALGAAGGRGLWLALTFSDGLCVADNAEGTGTDVVATVLLNRPTAPTGW